MTGVVMLVNKFPPLPAGGAEKQAERLSGFLAARGFDVGVLTRAAGGLAARERRDGFWIERVPAPGPGKVATVLFILGAMLALFRHRKRYEVLHAHLAFAPAVAAAIMGRLLGKRVIVKFGNSGAFGDIQVSQQSAPGRLKLALLRRLVDVNIALDDVMEAELLGAGFARARVLRMVNGIQGESFARRTPAAGAKAELGLAEKIVLLYLGRLAPQKALPDLLAALAQALPSRPDLHLLLLGQGEERAMLEAKARELALGGHVSFVGNVNDVQRYIDASDLFVLPSLAEGISNALLEAMAAGMPCIASAVGGTPEVLEQGDCGVLIPPSRPDLLRDAIVRLAGDPAERARLGAAARERIARTYAFSVVGDQYIDLYAHLTSRLRGPAADSDSVRA
jgi:glycosyltransferase involved in cell wall biosynthesis